MALHTLPASGAPFHCSTHPEPQLLPLAVRVKDAVPAMAEAGEMDVNVGGGLMVKPRLAEAAPPGFATETLAVPAACSSAAGTVAVSCVVLTNVVASGEPFHKTDAPDAKPLPATVNVNAWPPAVAVLGARLETTAAGALVTVNVCARERPPAAESIN